MDEDIGKFILNIFDEFNEQCIPRAFIYDRLSKSFSEFEIKKELNNLIKSGEIYYHSEHGEDVICINNTL